MLTTVMKCQLDIVKNFVHVMKDFVKKLTVIIAMLLLLHVLQA